VGLVAAGADAWSDVTIRVLIVDDEELVRTGLKMILDAQPNIEVVGTACDGQEALERAERLQPDVILMDVRMPRLNGLEATRRLLNRPDPKPRVVMLTTFDLDEYLYEALRVGASGFLLKDVPSTQLVQAIEVATKGEALLAPSATKRLIEEFIRRPPRKETTQLEQLTPREQAILQLIAGGNSNTEIARSLYISQATVKSHINHILTKLGVRDRAQAVIFAYESGLVTPQ
jgi:DNA-binding NarL/FixJ family response regulator